MSKQKIARRSKMSNRKFSFQKLRLRADLEPQTSVAVRYLQSKRVKVVKTIRYAYYK